MGPKVYLVDQDQDDDDFCAGPWQPWFLVPLWTAQTQSTLNIQKALVSSGNLHEFWFICCYFQTLTLGEKVKPLHCLGVRRSKECLCPSSTLTLSLDFSLPCNLRELRQGLHLPPSWLPLGKELFMAWQEGKRNGWRGSEEKELINGS